MRLRVRRWVLRFTLAGVVALALGYAPVQPFQLASARRVSQLRGDLDRLMDENVRLSEENRDLRQAVRQLREDPAATERVARDELGLVRRSDIVFQFE